MGILQKSAEWNFDHAIAGGVSGFVTRFLCQPLDVVKIRFQVNFKLNIHARGGGEGKFIL